MSIRHVAVGALAVLALIPLGSCTSVAPVKVSAGDQCFRCRRTISDERVASEIISANFVSKFRAPGCMAKYLVDHPGDGGTVFVTDYTTGKIADYDMMAQMIVQAKTVGLTLVWSIVGTFVILIVLRVVVGLRPGTDQEREGLDLVDHGERAYNY